MKFNLYKLKPGFRSIRFRSWVYFMVFALIILVTIWALQILMLNHYYSKTKMNSVVLTTTRIASKYSPNNPDSLNKVIKDIDAAAPLDDIYYQINQSGSPIYPTTTDIRWQKNINNVASKMELTASEAADGIIPVSKRSASAVTGDQSTSSEYFTYGLYLDPQKSIVLFVVAPLHPLQTTVTILQGQLLFVILIALVLGIFLAVLFSSRITNPLEKIVDAAARLADGEYGIVFPSSKKQYTEIRNLSRTLTKASRELQRSVDLQKDLLANVSHDIRTPLTMIKSYAEMIRDLSGDVPEKREKHLEVIINECDRLNVLVSDILTLSKFQAGTLEVEMAPFNIREAIAQVLSPYMILEKNEDYHIHFMCKEDYIVMGDEARIKQVVSNLFTNAIKFCGPDKQIYVNVRHWGRKIHIEVVDHGVGIEEENLENIWDRYYKSSKHHKRNSKGSGLGLSIAKEILEQHDAMYGVESKVGRGTTFWLELFLQKEEELPKKRKRKNPKITRGNTKQQHYHLPNPLHKQK